MHHICYGFLSNLKLKIPKNSAKKLNFWLIFGSFSITPSYSPAVIPQFLWKMKGLMNIYNRGKFHLYNICGCEVIKFEMFLRRNGASMKWPILGGLGALTPPNMIRFC